MSDYIEKEWRDYQKRLLQQAGNVQIRETRRAFYAGALTLQGIMMHKVSLGEEVTTEDEQLMLDLQAEFDRFIQDVQAGKA